MGIATSVDLAERAGSRRETATPANSLKTALSTVSAYIPSEALAVYVSVVGIFSPPETAPGFKVALFAGGSSWS